MESFVALLRAVNVGGTGKLPMTELVAICQAAGLGDVRTYIASGNVVFRSNASAAKVAAALEARLRSYAGKPVGVLVRSAAEMVEIVADNPFPDAPGNRVMVLFLDHPVASADIDGVADAADDETVRPGKRELYIHYGSGMAKSKLRIPAAKLGTARNINTVRKLAVMAAES